MKTAADFYECVLEMSYGELRAVADFMAETVKDTEARPRIKTGKEFADLLYDCAEANQT